MLRGQGCARDWTKCTPTRLFLSPRLAGLPPSPSLNPSVPYFSVWYFREFLGPQGPQLWPPDAGDEGLSDGCTPDGGSFFSSVVFQLGSDGLDSDSSHVVPVQRSNKYSNRNFRSEILDRNNRIEIFLIEIFESKYKNRNIRIEILESKYFVSKYSNRNILYRIKN